MQTENTITVIDHLSSHELNNAILQAGLVISRSGYTTIMDLVKLQQKAILIPTPSQTEQEYLAAYLMQKKIFSSVPQYNFSLDKALREAAVFPFTPPAIEQEKYKKIITELVSRS